MSLLRREVQTVESEVEEHASQAIFGSFDGMTSVLGVVAGLAFGPLHLLVAATIGLAVASAVGMGAGEYLGDAKHELHVAFIMALATLFGVILPVVPLFFLPHLAGLIGCGFIAVAITAVIAWRRHSWVETFAVLGLVAIATVAVGVLTGIS